VLVPPHRLTATARAIQPSHLLKLNGEALRDLCRADPPLGYVVMGAMAQTAMVRLHGARQQLTGLGRSA
jgi:CRP-like cAMP-binding protein